MYICNTCGLSFESPKLYHETYGQWIRHCPLCGSSDYAEVTVCPVCAEPWVDNGDLACQRCIERVRAALTENLTEKDYELAREILDELYDDTL